MRAVIVDDERLARDRLRQLLVAHPEIDVVAEADGVATAAAAIASMRPDVVFLDIEMRDATGFDLLRATPAFRTIFVTAFCDYAARAFDVDAVDYLLKPVTAERLARAIERARRASPRGASPSLAADDRVPLHDSRALRFVRVGDITAITADGPYTHVYVADGSRAMIQRTMDAWEGLLPASVFRRIHRSAIANLDFVHRAQRLMTGGYRLEMRSAPPLVVSRRYAGALRRTVLG
jgi:two-component system, LytTR family, response regulator